MYEVVNYGRTLLRNPPDPGFSEEKYIKFLAQWFIDGQSIGLGTENRRDQMFAAAAIAWAVEENILVEEPPDHENQYGKYAVCEEGKERLLQKKREMA